MRSVTWSRRFARGTGRSVAPSPFDCTWKWNPCRCIACGSSDRFTTRKRTRWPTVKCSRSVYGHDTPLIVGMNGIDRLGSIASARMASTKMRSGGEPPGGSTTIAPPSALSANTRSPSAVSPCAAQYQ